MRITSKGQVTIPVTIRQQLGLLPHTEVVFEVDDVIADPVAGAFAQRAEDRQWLAWLLDRLDERSRRILEWRFGHGLTLDQIGTREDLTRERVRQIERDALEKLRR